MLQNNMAKVDEIVYSIWVDNNPLTVNRLEGVKL